MWLRLYVASQCLSMLGESAARRWYYWISMNFQIAIIHTSLNLQNHTQNQHQQHWQNQQDWLTKWMLPFVARESWHLWCLQQQILYCNRYICMDVLSYSCSHVSFFSLSLSVRISPGLVPEARVCVFWSWDLWTVKDPFSVPREWSDSPSDHKYEGRRRWGGGEGWSHDKNCDKKCTLERDQSTWIRSLRRWGSWQD